MSYSAQLDWLNFFLADVRGGLGPYVQVFLLTHTPVGALIDVTHFKRSLFVVSVAALTARALAIASAPTVPLCLQRT